VFSFPRAERNIRWTIADTDSPRTSASCVRESNSPRVTKDTTRSDRTSSRGFGGRPSLGRIDPLLLSVIRFSSLHFGLPDPDIQIYIAGIICDDPISQHQEFARRVFLNSATLRPETPIRVVQHTFSSIDQLAEATAGWNLDWRQLDTGPLEATLLQVASADANFERVAFKSGRLTFGLIERTVGEIGWCHKNVSTDDLLVFSPGGDNDCVSKPGFRGHLVSYSEEHLELTAEDLELSLNLGPYREGGITLPIGAAAAEDLRRRLRRLDRAITQGSEDSEMRWIRHELEHEIPVRLLRLLATKPPTTPSLVDGFKARAARKARDFIDAHADEAPTIQDACRTAGVSWRTLNYAFREIFGVTPKQYLQATRLDGVRKELHRKGPASTVTDIANDWGFWHMGQFAADYKRQFGELPSETVRRATR